MVLAQIMVLESGSDGETLDLPDSQPLRVHHCETPQNGRRAPCTGFEAAAGTTWALRALFQRQIRAFAKVTLREENPIYQELCSTPNGIRTRAATLKGWMSFHAQRRIITDQGIFPVEFAIRKSNLGAPRASVRLHREEKVRRRSRRNNEWPDRKMYIWV